MTPSKRVAVAMSGGVDSSVAAALLVDQGCDVFGVMMRLWVEEGRVNRCCSPEDVNGARRVAAQLGIPFYVLDMKDAFRETVVSFFLRGYAQGITPNPCIECNRTIRWTYLLDDALRLGATHLATGHYARVQETGNGRTLLRGVDRQKDQSYVLSVLGQDELAHAVFPLGELTKAEVREYARQRNLPVAERPESQDLCFLAGGDYRDFLRRHDSESLTAGPILNTLGHQLGRHEGLAAYTVGQRRGLGVASNDPLYVIEKDLSRNALSSAGGMTLGAGHFGRNAFGGCPEKHPGPLSRPRSRCVTAPRVSPARPVPNRMAAGPSKSADR
jgi:tRNA-specific 2-thiouridylase